VMNEVAAVIQLIIEALMTKPGHSVPAVLQRLIGGIKRRQ
jgi:hypothetical protein